MPQTFAYARFESNGLGAIQSKRFPVSPQRVLALYHSGKSLTEIADLFVGMTYREIRLALEYALCETETDPARRTNMPDQLPRCPDSERHVSRVYEYANADKPEFGNSTRDLRKACDKAVIEVFEAFHAEGKVWNGTTNIPYLKPQDIRKSMRRMSRMDLWEKVNPRNRLNVPADTSESRYRRFSGAAALAQRAPEGVTL